MATSAQARGLRDVFAMIQQPARFGHHGRNGHSALNHVEQACNSEREPAIQEMIALAMKKKHGHALEHKFVHNGQNGVTGHLAAYRAVLVKNCVDVNV